MRRCCQFRIPVSRFVSACLLALVSISVFVGGAYANTPEMNQNETGDDECLVVEVPIDPCEEENTANPQDNNTDDDNTDVTSTTIAGLPASMIGNPISLFTGNKYQKEVDYQSPSTRLQFIRHYNSKGAGFSTGFGQGWSSTLGATIRKYGELGYNVTQGNGSLIEFHTAVENAAGETVYRSVNPSSGFIQVNGDEYIWIIPDGRTLQFKGSLLARIDFPGKAYLQLKYRQMRVVEVSDEHGRVMLLDYYPNGLPSFNDEKYKAAPGHLSSVTLPNGDVQQYLYDNNVNLTRVRYSDGTNRTYHYENSDYPNHLTGITNRNGVRYATWRYDELGKAISSEHANKVESVSIEYFPMDVATGVGTTQITNSLGEVSTYEWQRFADTGQMVLLSSRGPGCVTCPKPNMRYTYNSYYQVTTETRVNEVAEPDMLALDDNAQPITGHNETHYIYDEQGRLSEIHRIAADGQSRLLRRFEYHGEETRASTIAQPSVNPREEYRVEIEYNNEFLIERVTEVGYEPTDESRLVFNKLERSTLFTYNDGLIEAIDGPRTDVDDVTRFSYDALGRLALVDTPTGRQLKLNKYDEDGRPVEFQIANRSPMSVSYDANGNISEVSMRSETVRYEHDAENQLMAIVDPYGRRHTFDYDDAGRMTRATDDMGLSIEYLKDTENRLKKRSLFGMDGTLVRSIDYAFDAENRLHSRHEESANASSGNSVSNERSLKYDELNRLVSISNSTGIEAELSYDRFGKVSQIREAGQLSATFEYDVAGRLTAEVDARGNRTETIYDDFGRVVSLISPDSGISRYRYDLAGNRVRFVSGEGEVIEYEWDVGNRLVRETSIDGTTRFEFHANGRLSKTSNPDATELFEYDQHAQLTKHTRILAGEAYSTQVEYNQRGQVEKKVLPNGQVLRYHYYKDGLNIGTLRAITREAVQGLTQETLVGEIDLEARDGQTGYLSHNGVRTQRNYHASGRIESINISNTLSLSYTFDDRGNISGIDEDGISQSFLYNGRKLVLANTLGGEYAYAYDEAGNRIASYEADVNKEPTEKEYIYSDSGSGNRLLSTTDVDSGEVSEFEYNNAGSALRAGAEFTYEYNVKQRPIAVYKSGELLAEYRYNSFGERVQKTVYENGDSETTYYLYDGHSLVAEIGSDGQVASQYVYLQNKFAIAKLDGKQVFAIHTDHLGTPRKITDDTAKVVWEAVYSPFGRATIVKESVQLNLRFPGQYEDLETRTHYNYFRDYDPGTGRYTTSDPLGLQAGVNTYAYASSNPILGTDVIGLDDDINDDNIIDKVKEFVAEAGDEGVQKAIDIALGEHFVAVATQTLQQIPGEFQKLVDGPDDKYNNLPVASLKPLFSAEAAADMAFTFAVLFTIKKGASLAGKTSIFSYAAHQLLKKLVGFALKAFIVKQFGEAAGEFFENLDQLAQKIEDVAQNENYTCEDTEEIAAEIARMLADVALHSPDNLRNFFNKVKLKKPQPKKDCNKTNSNDDFKDCYKQMQGFANSGISVDTLKRIESALGADASVCRYK